MTPSTPGETRQNGYGDRYVFDSRDGDSVRVYDLAAMRLKPGSECLIKVPLDRWRVWQIVVCGQVEALEI